MPFFKVYIQVGFRRILPISGIDMREVNLGQKNKKIGQICIIQPVLRVIPSPDTDSGTLRSSHPDACCSRGQGTLARSR